MKTLLRIAFKLVSRVRDWRQRRALKRAGVANLDEYRSGRRFWR